jgi:SAM-dependent methyltransferase
MVVGVDLAGAHVQVARRGYPEALLVQGDIRLTPLRPASFDAIWCVNTLHHLRDSGAGLRHLICLLRDQGRLGIVQSALLPEMVFAWDSRLERAVNDAVRSYYLQRYGVAERDLTGVRNLLGQLRASPLSRVRAQTLVIERAAPLSAADSEYLLEAIFRNTWGERLKPWLDPDDFEQLQRLCDPDDPEFALQRADFHYLQTLTLVSGQVA